MPRVFVGMSRAIPWFALGVTLLVFVSLALPRLLVPVFHMDEGYYLGAAMRLLNGDPLLRTSSFDKPFLTAAGPLLGVFLAGENAIGFRLTGVLAGACLIVVLFVSARSLARTGHDEASTRHRWALTAAAFLASAIPFLGAFPLRYLVSAFSEPLLLLFLALAGVAIREASESRSPRALRRAFLWLGFAFLTKSSAIQWAPAFLAAAWVVAGKGMTGEADANAGASGGSSSPTRLSSSLGAKFPVALQGFLSRAFRAARLMFRSGRAGAMVLAAGITYSAFNPTKFAPYTFYQVFKHRGAADAPPLLERIASRAADLARVLGGGMGVVGISLLCATVIGFAFHHRADSRMRRWALVWLLPCALQVAVLALAGTKVYDRYWLPVLLHGALTLHAFVSAAPARARRPVVAAALVAALGSLTGLSLSKEYYFEGAPSLDTARAFERLREEARPGGTLFHEGFSWNLAPYVVAPDLTLRPAHAEGVADFLGVRGVGAGAWLLLEPTSGSGTLLRPFLSSESTTRAEIVVTEESLISFLRERVKVRWAERLEVVSVRRERLPCRGTEVSTALGVRLAGPWCEESPVVVEVEAFLGPKHARLAGLSAPIAALTGIEVGLLREIFAGRAPVARMGFEIGVASGAAVEAAFGREVSALGLRFVRFDALGAIEVSDAVPMLFRSRFLPWRVLPYGRDHHALSVELATAVGDGGGDGKGDAGGSHSLSRAGETKQWRFAVTFAPGH